MLDSKPLQIVIATACISTLVLLTNKSDLSESTKNAYRKFLEDIRLENCPNSPLHLVNKSEAVNWKTNEDKQNMKEGKKETNEVKQRRKGQMKTNQITFFFDGTAHFLHS